MDNLWLASGAALWLGILTSISPCPLATNIAAVSYISQRVTNAPTVMLSGIFYTLGRMLTYIILGMILVSSLLAAPDVSFVLEKYMNRVLGPLLVIIGMFLVELLSFNLGGIRIVEKAGRRVETWGTWGALLLGALFALSFCPISAALFFGSLLPLALKSQSSVGLPAIYGTGTALPVLGFSILLTVSAKSVSRIFEKITSLEKWARWFTGLIFISIGIYYSVVFIFLTK